MPVIRVKKNKNYTTMANYHLQDKNLSLKAKGIMSLMLSLPEDWDYSTAGLTALSRDGVDSVKSSLKELETNGYLKRERIIDNATKRVIDWIYYIYEKPQAEFPQVEKPVVENPTQQNINKQSTNKQKKNIKKSWKSQSHIKISEPVYKQNPEVEDKYKNVSKEEIIEMWNEKKRTMGGK